MAKILQKLSSDGKHLSEPERIQMSLEPGILSASDQVVNTMLEIVITISDHRWCSAPLLGYVLPVVGALTVWAGFNKIILAWFNTNCFWQ